MSYIDDYTGIPHEGPLPGSSLLDYYDQIEFDGFNAGMRDGRTAATQYSNLTMALNAYMEDFDVAYEMEETTADDYQTGFIIGYGEMADDGPTRTYPTKRKG